MKSEWEFRFEARGFHFEKEHKFNATANESIDLGNGPIAALEFFVRVVPSQDEPPPFVEQVGSLFVTLPGSQEQTKSFGYYVARVMADRITFQSGDFRIQYGFVTCKRVAETPEEEAEFGDKLYSIELRLQEMVPAAPFDSGAFAKQSSQPLHPGLISQYNETKLDRSPIRQFLGFFRILESLYHSGTKKKTLAQALLSSDDLRNAYISVVDGGDFDVFVETVVDVRHQCAHLKLGNGFGFVPADPLIESKVKPYLTLLATLAHVCITGKWAPKNDA